MIKKKSPCNVGDSGSIYPWVGKILWRREWQLTPVFLSWKSYEQRSLVGYSPRGCNEWDMTERLNTHAFVGQQARNRETNLRST